MADFVDSEAEESSESEPEINHAKRKRKAKAPVVKMEEEDEEEEDDEEQLREELKDLIDDDSIDESNEESDDSMSRKKRKKSESPDFDDRLEDDDYDLIEENLGITVERKKRFKRLRRVEEQDSEDETEQQPIEDRDAIANELFDGSGDEEDKRSVISRKQEPEIFREDESAAESSDPDDFIVDDEGRPVTEKRRKKKTTVANSALQEAQEIFGVDFDYKEFEKYGDDRDVDEEEDEDEYADEDVDGERVRPVKKIPKKKSNRKSIFEVYEPFELKRGHFTDLDNMIRSTDIPERMQLRSVPITPVPEGSDELTEEAKWIYKYAFCRPTISIQDAHLTDEAKERARKGPQAIPKIRKALDFMRNQNFEVPFISFYRKEYVNPELNINDLWKVYKWDAKWCELRDRKENLKTLFEKTRAYQLDEIMRNRDADLPPDMRVIKEDDIDRLKSVETSEELIDVHHHFMLHYGQEISKMQEEIRLKREAQKLSHRRISAFPDIDNLDEDNDVNEQTESDEIIKQAVRSGPYVMCRKAGLEEFSKKFGLTPEQYGENLRDNYHRHEIEQETLDPSTIALEYRSEKFEGIEDILKAVQLMVAIQLAREPLVRKCVREMYMERAKICVRPTPRGIKEIDENHVMFSCKYLKGKPARELEGDEYLKLTIAERDKLVTVSFSDTIEGVTSNNYLDEMKQLYHRDEFSKVVQDWNALRAEAIETAFHKFIIPDLKKELSSNLLIEAKEYVVRSSSRKMYNWIRDAPYTCNLEKPKAAQIQQDEECWDDDNEATNNKDDDRELDEEWQTNKGLRVMGVAYVPDYSQAAFACIISPEGECTDYLRLPNLLRRKNSPREEDVTMKEADLLSIENFISTKKPHVVVIGGESREAIGIRDDIKECISKLVAENDFPMIEVEINENELAKIYSNSNRGNEEFRDYPIILRQAISVARRLQDPLIEFSQLCGIDDEILCLNYHSYQDQVTKEELLEGIQLEFVNRVNEVGVDLNKALQHENTANLVQFVCGLGSRKAQALIKLLKQTNKRIENRTQLVTICHMGPKVFINCAGFIKIDTTNLGDSTDTYVEILDSTRVHPETYEWARKMAVDALEYDDDEETNPADALHEIFQSPERLKDLDLDAFAEELERQGFGNKSITLYDIRAELTCRYKDLRAPYEPPTPEKLFNILTKETPETFYIGKLVLATVSMINRRKPDPEQLDQANPVRNDITGLWQCPFCQKNDFLELADVWTHFDTQICEGKPIGVRLRLDNGLSGYIHIKNISDKHVDNPEERVRRGQVIHCRVIKIEVDRFSVECSSKGSDLADPNQEWRPPRDTYYDTEAEETAQRIEEETKKNKQRQAYIKRVIVHSAFHNINYSEAAKLMAPMKQGEAIVRPSSKGNDRLTVTWKVTDDVLHHIDVREECKKFAFSLGKRLFIGKEEFEDLDEIIARYVNPMAAYASELLECHYYRPNIDGIEEKANQIMKEKKEANPSRIPCILSASKKYPGKFLLSYMPRERCVHEYISVSHNGVRYRNQTFPRVGELFDWFRKHFRDPIPRPMPKTPLVIPNTASTPNIDDGMDEDWDNPSQGMGDNGTPYQKPMSTSNKLPGSQFGNTYPSTPYTPTAKTPHMTPMSNAYQTPMTPRYGQATPMTDNAGFLHPGVPPSMQGWSQSSANQQKSNDSNGDYYNWKRASNNSDSENSRGRGRGRGGNRGGDRGGYYGGDRGGNRGGSRGGNYGGGRGEGRGRGRGEGRGRGRGEGRGRGRGGWSRGNRGGQGDLDSSCDASSTYSGYSSNQGTPSWDDDNASTAEGLFGKPIRSGAKSPTGNNTPLWDENENWDAETPATTTGKSNTNSSFGGQTSNGNRTPLWDASESWDDSEPTPVQPKQSTNQQSGNIQQSRNAPSQGNSSLWDESEDWDNPQPKQPVNQRSGNIQQPRAGPSQGNVPSWNESESWDNTQPKQPANQRSGNIQQSRNAPSQGNSSLWDESEDWDNPQPKQPANQRSGNINQPKVGPSQGNLPLWDESESWDNPQPTQPANQRSGNINQTRAGSSQGNLPLWDESESWDNPQPTQPANQRSGNTQPTKVTPSQGNLPLWDEGEDWDNPQPTSTQANRPVNQRSGGFQQTNNEHRKGNRAPSWNRNDSWDNSQSKRPPNQRNRNFQQTNAAPSQGNAPPWKKSGNWDDSRSKRPPNQRNRNFQQTNVPPSQGNAPLWNESESWDDPQPTRPANQRNDNIQQPGVAPPQGNRSPLWDESESWDDPQPTPAQTKQPVNQGSGNQQQTSIAPPSGNRTPLWDASESWDDPEPSSSQTPKQTNTNLQNNPGRTDVIAPPMGNRTPLWDASESWDDPSPAQKQTSSSKPNYQKSFTSPNANNSPLWSSNDNWNNKNSTSPRKDGRNNFRGRGGPRGRQFGFNSNRNWDKPKFNSNSRPQSRQFQPKAESHMTRDKIIIPTKHAASQNENPEPLYDPSESWDEPEKDTTKDSDAASTTSVRTPLYEMSKFFDDSLDTHSPKASFCFPQTNVISRAHIRPAGSRTPLYTPSESWDLPKDFGKPKVEKETKPRQPFNRIPRIKSAQSGNQQGQATQHSANKNKTSGSSNIPKSSSNRSPLYDESESWD